MNNLLLGKRSAEFRREHGIGAEDPLSIQSILRKLNVLTLFKPISPNFSGMAIKVTDEGRIHRFMLINSNQSIGKQNFSVCHELYHLYIQQEFSYNFCNTGAFNIKDAAEYNADVFAAHLLLPESGVKSLIPDNELSKNKITLETLLKIENYFKCSRSALLYRLLNLNLIDKRTRDYFSSDVKKGAALLGYSLSLYEPGNKDVIIGDYGSLAKKLFDKDVISESHYYSLLSDIGMNLSEIDFTATDGEQ